MGASRGGAIPPHSPGNPADTPLFIAEVDRDQLRVIRSSERVLLPNRGARLGNFSVTRVTADEVWVTDSEWMQPRGCEKYGADGTVWVGKIRFQS